MSRDTIDPQIGKLEKTSVVRELSSISEVDSDTSGVVYFADTGEVSGFKNGVKKYDSGVKISPLTPFDDKFLITNIDDLTWAFGGTGANVTKELSTDHARHNANTIKISCDAVSGQNGYGQAAFASTLDLSGYDYFEFAVFSDEFNKNDITALTIFLFTSAYSTTTNGYSATCYIAKPGWNLFRVSKAGFSNLGTPDWANINWIRLRANSTVNNVRTIYFAEAHAAKANQRRAVVSLGFDDGIASAYQAGALAAARNIRMTYYLVESAAGQAGYMTESQMAQLPHMGHELGLHGGYSGYASYQERYNALGREAFIDYINTAKVWIESLGGDSEIGSYPQGVFAESDIILSSEGSGIVTALRECGIKYMRTIGLSDLAVGKLYYHYLSSYPRSGLILSGGPTLGNTNSLLAVKAIIDEVINSGGWINIYGHALNLVANDSVTWSRSDFIELLDYLVSKRDSGLLDIRPFGEVARDLEIKGYITSVPEY